MDPNVTLAAIRYARSRMLATEHGSDEYGDAAQTLEEHVAALDEWLSRGGFLPTAWARA